MSADVGARMIRGRGFTRRSTGRSGNKYLRRRRANELRDAAASGVILQLRNVAGVVNITYGAYGVPFSLGWSGRVLVRFEPPDRFPTVVHVECSGPEHVGTMVLSVKTNPDIPTAMDVRSCGSIEVRSVVATEELSKISRVWALEAGARRRFSPHPHHY